MTKKQVRIQPTPRWRDEIVLEWLALRAAGWGPARIAARYGTTRTQVHVATDRVRVADLAESGEPPETVKKGYW